VILVSHESHAVPRGDPFTDTGVIILVEFEQINFLAPGNVLPENIEPFHAGVTRYDFWRHGASRPVNTGVVQKTVHGDQVCGASARCR
jgi:hypothetical protein